VFWFVVVVIVVDADCCCCCYCYTFGGTLIWTLLRCTLPRCFTFVVVWLRCCPFTLHLRLFTLRSRYDLRCYVCWFTLLLRYDLFTLCVTVYTCFVVTRLPFTFTFTLLYIVLRTFHGCYVIYVTFGCCCCYVRLLALRLRLPLRCGYGFYRYVTLPLWYYVDFTLLLRYALCHVHVFTFVTRLIYVVCCFAVVTFVCVAVTLHVYIVVTLTLRFGYVYVCYSALRCTFTTFTVWRYRLRWRCVYVTVWFVLRYVARLRLRFTLLPLLFTLPTLRSFTAVTRVWLPLRPVTLTLHFVYVVRCPDVVCCLVIAFGYVTFPVDLRLFPLLAAVGCWFILRWRYVCCSCRYVTTLLRYCVYVVGRVTLRYVTFVRLLRVDFVYVVLRYVITLPLHVAILRYYRLILRVTPRFVWFVGICYVTVYVYVIVGALICCFVVDSLDVDYGGAVFYVWFWFVDSLFTFVVAALRYVPTLRCYVLLFALIVVVVVTVVVAFTLLLLFVYCYPRLRCYVYVVDCYYVDYVTFLRRLLRYVTCPVYVVDLRCFVVIVVPICWLLLLLNYIVHVVALRFVVIVLLFPRCYVTVYVTFPRCTLLLFCLFCLHVVTFTVVRCYVGITFVCCCYVDLFLRYVCSVTFYVLVTDLRYVLLLRCYVDWRCTLLFCCCYGCFTVVTHDSVAIVDLLLFRCCCCCVPVACCCWRCFTFTLLLLLLRLLRLRCCVQRSRCYYVTLYVGCFDCVDCVTLLLLLLLFTFLFVRWLLRLRYAFTRLHTHVYVVPVVLLRCFDYRLFTLRSRCCCDYVTGYVDLRYVVVPVVTLRLPDLLLFVCCCFTLFTRLRYRCQLALLVTFVVLTLCCCWLLRCCVAPR